MNQALRLECVPAALPVQVEGKSWWQQRRHKFAYLTTRNDSFACAFFIFGPFADVLVISTT